MATSSHLCLHRPILCSMPSTAAGERSPSVREKGAAVWPAGRAVRQPQAWGAVSGVEVCTEGPRSHLQMGQQCPESHAHGHRQGSARVGSWRLTPGQCNAMDSECSLCDFAAFDGLLDEDPWPPDAGQMWHVSPTSNLGWVLAVPCSNDPRFTRSLCGIFGIPAKVPRRKGPSLSCCFCATGMLLVRPS